MTSRTGYRCWPCRAAVTANEIDGASWLRMTGPGCLTEESRQSREGEKSSAFYEIHGTIRVRECPEARAIIDRL